MKIWKMNRTECITFHLLDAANRQSDRRPVQVLLGPERATVNSREHFNYYYKFCSVQARNPAHIMVSAAAQDHNINHHQC